MDWIRGLEAKCERSVPKKKKRERERYLLTKDECVVDGQIGGWMNKWTDEWSDG